MLKGLLRDCEIFANLRLKLYLQPPGGAPVPRPLLQLDLVQDPHLALKQHRFAGTVSVVL